MVADPRDDFAIFADSEHMFFGLSDPYALIRSEIVDSLQRQVAGTKVESVRCHGEPKWLTLGRKLDDDPTKVVVGHFGVCFQCTVEVVTPEHAERLEATISLMFRDIDRPEDRRMSVAMDLHADAAAAFDDDAFQDRFLKFRGGAA